MSSKSELKKLSEESLTRQPEEVFDVICKLGEGSYGSVYKALHKESGQVLAIKQVPVDTDLQEIIKEISIMQQCDSPYVVKYYGSYFKNTDLWIVMEYCGAGSVSDIMRLRKKTLSEEEIATILCDTLKGLEYLHLRKKIHRDIKAGNILLNTEGHAKLADFGVAGQLTDTMAKRNTVIGTPFWMAPEVIQEIGYDCVADIWSLGITALEMAEGKPPYGDIHPMRAIFMIPTKPPPTLRDLTKWSPDFVDFVNSCLVKNPEERPSASQMLNHNFIKNAKPATILLQLIAEAREIREKLYATQEENKRTNITLVDENLSRTLVRIRNKVDDGDKTLVPEMLKEAGSLTTKMSTLTEELNTMVINSDETDDEATMKRHDTGSADYVKEYRPLFMDHFDKKETQKYKEIQQLPFNLVPKNRSPGQSPVRSPVAPTGPNAGMIPPVRQSTPEFAGPSRISGPHVPGLSVRGPYLPGSSVRGPIRGPSVPGPSMPGPHMPGPSMAGPSVPGPSMAGSSLPGSSIPSPKVENTELLGPSELVKYRTAIMDRNFDFLKFLSFDELQHRVNSLDSEMEKEILELRNRYQTKRKPILEAIDKKKKRQPPFP